MTKSKSEELKESYIKKETRKGRKGLGLSQKGLAAKEIARKLGLSEKAVRTYVWRKKNPPKIRKAPLTYLVPTLLTRAYSVMANIAS